MTYSLGMPKRDHQRGHDHEHGNCGVYGSGTQVPRINTLLLTSNLINAWVAGCDVIIYSHSNVKKFALDFSQSDGELAMVGAPNMGLGELPHCFGISQ